MRRDSCFAEIGAGQEVVRWFFQVGGEAGAVAKTLTGMLMSPPGHGGCLRKKGEP